MLARKHFVASVARVFEPFFTTFQSEARLIHVLHEELSNVLRLLLLKFVKNNDLTNISGSQLLALSLDNRPIDSCEFGADTQTVLQKLKKYNNTGFGLLKRDMP